MDKYIHNEQNGLWYELQGDYYLPCLKLPEEPEVHIGIWGQRHRRYLKGHHKALYTSLLTSGKLNSYLADINRAGRRNVLSAGKSAFRKRGRNGSTQSGTPNAVGTEDEQHPQHRYGGCFKRFNLRITNNRKGCCQATAAFLFREVFKKS